MIKKLIIISFLLLAFPAYATDLSPLKQAYKIAHENYLEPLDVGKVAVLGLKGINKTDKDFTIADDAKRISAYYKSKIIRSYKKPAANDLKGWISVSEKVIKDAKKTSNVINEKDFELVDNMLGNAFSNLDKGTHYYPLADEPEDNIKHFSSKNYNDVLYIKLADFNSSSVEKFKTALKPYIVALVLDLRGNSGGQLGEAIEIAKLLAGKGVIASVKERGDKPVKYYVSEEAGVFANRPIVVLVDGNTASSAELLAETLREQGRAKIVGTTTYGKGTVQSVFSLSNEGRLALSTAYLHTPSGNGFDKTGIMPDVCTSDAIRVNDKSQCHRENRIGIESDLDTALDMLKDY